MAKSPQMDASGTNIWTGWMAAEIPVGPSNTNRLEKEVMDELNSCNRSGCFISPKPTL